MKIKAGSYVITLGSGIGIVFVLLGRRILYGKPGVSQRGTSLALSTSSIVHEKGRELLQFGL